MAIRNLATGPLAILIVFGSLLSLYLVQIIPAIWPEKIPHCDELTQAEIPRVVMYGTSWCQFCRKSRWLFEDNNVSYCEYDIETSLAGAEQFKQLGGNTIPLIRIDNQRLNGFDEDNLTAALRHHGLL